MDVIALENVRAHGKHGANPGERDREQPFDVDIRIEIDLDAPAASDRLDDTLDYARLHERVVRIVSTTSFTLLERLAAEILQDVFADPRAVRAEVRIGKPRLLDGATPSVTLRRENPRCARQ